MFLLVRPEVLGIINVIKLSREYEKDAEIRPIKCDLKIHKSINLIYIQKP
jgi:hypothetical protein